MKDDEHICAEMIRSVCAHRARIYASASGQGALEEAQPARAPDPVGSHRLARASFPMRHAAPPRGSFTRGVPPFLCARRRRPRRAPVSTAFARPRGMASPASSVVLPVATVPRAQPTIIRSRSRPVAAARRRRRALPRASEQDARARPPGTAWRASIAA